MQIYKLDLQCNPFSYENLKPKLFDDLSLNLREILLDFFFKYML